MDKIREEFESNAREIYGEEMSFDFDDERGVYVYEKTCNAFALFQSAKASQWISVEDELPANCQPVYVEEPQCYRFHHYKPASQQYKKGIKGRWQKFDGYGWSNCEQPSRYKLKATE